MPSACLDVTEVPHPEVVAQGSYCRENELGGLRVPGPQRRAGLTHLKNRRIRRVNRFGGILGTMDREPNAGVSERDQEARQIRRLQMMISMVMSVISQDHNLTLEEASELVAGAKRAALAMFPDKELAYDLLYKPRLQRLMNERFRLQ